MYEPQVRVGEGMTFCMTKVSRGGEFYHTETTRWPSALPDSDRRDCGGSAATIFTGITRRAIGATRAADRVIYAAKLSVGQSRAALTPRCYRGGGSTPQAAQAEGPGPRVVLFRRKASSIYGSRGAGLPCGRLEVR